MFSIDRDDLTIAAKKYITEKCSIKGKKDIYDKNPPTYFTFKTENIVYNGKKTIRIYIPLGLWIDILCDESMLNIEPSFSFPNSIESDNEPKSDNSIYYRIPIERATFKGSLLAADTDPSNRGRDQDIVFSLLKDHLEKYHTVLLELYTGFGKTVIGCKLFTEYRYPSMILTFSNVVKNNWASELARFTDLKVLLIDKEKTIPLGYDVYIIGIEKCSKFRLCDFQHIKLLLIDEVHMSSINIFTEVIFLFSPIYLVGMSATPDARSDGLNSLYTPFFGTEYIVRKEVKECRLIRLLSGYRPEQLYRVYKGRTCIDWIATLNDKAQSEYRHIMIRDLVMDVLCGTDLLGCNSTDPSKAKIVVMCERIATATAVFNLLKDCVYEESDIDLYIENAKKFSLTARVIISTGKKLGTGSNVPGLNYMILDCTPKDIRQIYGRVRDIGGTVIDIVDDCKTSGNHWKERYKFYIEAGATIEDVYYIPISSTEESV